jgi:aryl carrier-like protein
MNRLLYRTGDLVRWDGQGRLRFLGRNDRQVKVRGFRIELDAVGRVLREYPAVRDAAVVPTGSSAADRRLLAGVVAEADPGLVETLRAFAAERLPGHAIPSLWAVVGKLPITRNGKLDVARLRDLADRSAAAPGAATPDGTPCDSDGGAAPDRRDAIARTVSRSWREVLGTDQFGADERFFDVGGDSLQLLRVAASLRRELPGCDVTIQDLYACQTIRALSERLVARRRAGQ